MKVIYHIGLHSTDEDRALICLLRNADALAAKGTVIAVPGRFRSVVREAMIHLQGSPADAATQEHLLDEITDEDRPDCLFFSSDSFLCVPQKAISDGTLYPQAAERAPWMRNLFPDDPAEFVFALRNPATFIPAIHARFAKQESFEAYLDRIEPERLDWLDMIRRLQSTVPGCPITVWANEDTPLIWPSILQAMSDHPDGMELDGVNDFPGTLMSADGFKRMTSYLDSHPTRNAEHRQRVVAAFLDKFAQEEAVEAQYDLPGWTEDLIARLTDRYEAQLACLDDLPGVRVLKP